VKRYFPFAVPGLHIQARSVTRGIWSCKTCPQQDGVMYI
jgi:hypothetical protein